MIELKTISIRTLDKGLIPQFFNSDLGIREYIRINFQNTGKLVSMSSNISEDYTIETKTLVFKSQEDYEDFINNEILQYQENVIRYKYNIYHRITSTTTITTI